MTFYVYGDGKLLARSPAMRFGQAPATLSADIRGVRVVELVARTPRPTRLGEAVTWGEAALTD